MPPAHVLASVLHVMSGSVVIFAVAISRTRSSLDLFLVASVALLSGLVISLLPWHRWPRNATRILIVEMLAVVAAFNLVADDPYLYAMWPLVTWAWVGLTQPEGTATSWSPLLAVAYVVPGVLNGDTVVVVASAVFVIPISIIIAEMIASVTDRLRRNEQLLLGWAYTDPLTGLANRKALREHIEEALLTPEGRDQLGLLFIDLDGFKYVNDSLGHSVGDQLLTAIGRRLAGGLESGRLFRIGGDEFVVTLDSAEVEHEARRCAERLIDCLAPTLSVQGRDLQMSSSVGIALGCDADTTDQLLACADLAMYRAKRAGGNRWARFDTVLAHHAQRRVDLESELRKALDADDLYVLFQPEIDLDTGKVVDAETLVRWNHDDLGRLDPTEFIAVAEESGLIIQVGEAVLDRALHFARECADAGSDVTVSVNVSAHQLCHMKFVSSVAELLERHGVRGEALCLEITESALLDRAVEQVIPALKQLGVKLAIDDFGTGYSSLSYLQRLPVDSLKIDRSFLNPVGTTANTPLLTAIVQMGHTLDLTVVAEGVETPEQLALLRQIGCDRAQGYLFARALTSCELLETLVAVEHPTTDLSTQLSALSTRRLPVADSGSNRPLPSARR